MNTSELQFDSKQVNLIEKKKKDVLVGDQA